MDQRLYSAAFAGDIESLHKLLQENPFVLSDYMLTTQAENPLNIAAKARQLHFVQEVIKIKPDLAKEQSQDGFRPLDIAAAFGHVEIVRELLATFDPKICRLPGRDGRTAIHYAAMNGRIEVIHELLNACSDSIKDVTALGETALHLAVKYFKFEAFRRLIEWLEKIALRELVNWKDKEGNTVLHCAISRKQLETVEFMLDQNNAIGDTIDKNSVNTKGLTPMDILDIVIESSSDVQLRNLLQEARAVGVPEIQIVSKIQSSEDVVDTCNQPENVQIPDQKQKNSIDYFRFRKERDSPAEARDMLLVVVALIATVTFEAGINPPSHIFEVSGQPTYNITSQSNSTISWDLNSTASALQNVFQESSESARMVSLTVFLVANSIALSASFSIIDYLRKGLPFQRELRVSGSCMMFAYGWSLGYTKPTGIVKDICLVVALLAPLFISSVPELVKSISKHKEDSPDQH